MKHRHNGTYLSKKPKGGITSKTRPIHNADQQRPNTEAQNRDHKLIINQPTKPHKQPSNTLELTIYEYSTQFADQRINPVGVK